MQILFYTNNRLFLLLHRKIELLFKVVFIIYESHLNYNMHQEIHVFEIKENNLRLFECFLLYLVLNLLSSWDYLDS